MKMGHDISSHTVKIVKEISYLRRSMNQNDINDFYESLGCSQFNHGVSGNGQTILIEKYILEEALEDLKKKKMESDMIEFLKKSIAELKDDEDVIAISFC